MLKKKLIVLNATIILGIGSIVATPGVNAENISDMESKKKKIEEQRSGINSNINNTDAKIKSLQGQQDKLEAEIKRIDLAVADTNAKIREKNDQISSQKAEVAKLEEEIVVLKERIEKRNEVLKTRALSFQESGGKGSYFEVLLGASSFSDFVERASAVSTIMKADEELVRQHEADKKNLEKIQAEVKEKLAELESMRKELEGMKAQLSQQKATKDKLMDQLEKEEKDAHSYKMTLEEENELLRSQQSSIDKAIALEKKRKAELEAARKAAASKAAASQATSGGSGSSSSSGSNSSSGGGSSQGPAVSAGAFTKPTNGVLTSGFGMRNGKMHYGVDIANRADVPVVSAADGVVARSYYSPSYGNAIFITHSVNGQVYTTVYAHLETRGVQTGATVSKGQKIGIMGNTGASRGQHLHFELHKGAWSQSKSGAINPSGIVPL